MVPSTPTFSPSKYEFNSSHEATQNLASSDGVIQVKDIEGASVFVDKVQVPYESPAVQVNGTWLTHYTNRNGQVTLAAWENEEASVSRSITAEFNITKIVYGGVSYYPANI